MAPLRTTLAALAAVVVLATGSNALAAPKAAVETARPDAAQLAGQAKVLPNVSEAEAMALFRSLEHMNKSARHKQKVDGSKPLVGKVRYLSGATQQTDKGWFLPVRVESTYEVMGNKLAWAKTFLFEWDARTGTLRAEIDHPRVSKGEFNVKLSTRSGKATAAVRVAERNGEGAIDSTTKTIYLKNVPFEVFPHIYLNREGNNRLIKVWAGQQFRSELSAKGVAVPGTKRDVNIDLKANLRQIGLQRETRTTTNTDTANVDIDGAIYTSFTYEQKFVPRKVSWLTKVMSFVRRIPSAVNLEVRPRFRYQVQTGALVAQGSSMGIKTRFFRPRALPSHRIRDAKLKARAIAKTVRAKVKAKTARRGK